MRRGQVIEEMFAEIAGDGQVMRASGLLLIASDALARANRKRYEARGRELLSGSRRGAYLSASAASLSQDDLESAWQCAMRGDVDGALKRLAPSVRVRRVQVHEGTPWRLQDGWVRRG